MLNVVILAAGKGTRMQSEKPKVLHTIAGKPMVRHLLDTVRSINPSFIIMVVGHKADEIKQHFDKVNDIAFVKQQPQLGTGHAVKQMMPHVDTMDKSISLVLYGDVPMVSAATLKDLLSKCSDGKTLSLLTQVIDNPQGYGRVVRNADNAVNAIVEHKDATAEQLQINEINTGILAAPTNLLNNWLSRINNNNSQGEYYLTDIVQLAVQDGINIETSTPNYDWETLGVNDRLQQATLERTWQQHQANLLMQAGTTIVNPNSFDLRGKLDCDKDVFIDVGCVFIGNVTLEEGVHIGPHCILKDCTIGKNTVVNAFSHIDSSTVGSNSSIGPYARLRPGSDLGNSVHVGNFVEIKNSSFGHNSKASHLSYIGDAVLGESVNVGAGTITCNYDGANKHQTIIEDNSFIGSGSQLVAPVRVERGAVIGAGTTLTSDAPEGQLTLSRAQQKTVFGWVKPVKNTKK